MPMRSLLSHILTGLAAFVVLTGVSAADSISSAGVVMPRPPSFSHPARDPISHGLAVPGVMTTFIVTTDGAVELFDKYGRRLGYVKQQFEFPVGLAVDTSENLYVTDESTETISILPPPYASTRTVLNDTGFEPFSVAVDANGNVAAMNNDGSVSLFAKGATSPTRIVSNPAFAYGGHDAFDARGNLYVEGRNSKAQSLVGIIVGGINGTTINLLTAENGLFSVEGIQVTTQGRIAILEGYGTYMIDTYNPPNRQTGSFGKPISSTILAKAGSPADFVFTPSNAFVVVADEGYCPPGGHCSVIPAENAYAYPAGGNPIESVLFRSDGDGGNEPLSTAVSPPEVP